MTRIAIAAVFALGLALGAAPVATGHAEAGAKWSSASDATGGIHPRRASRCGTTRARRISAPGSGSGAAMPAVLTTTTLVIDRLFDHVFGRSDDAPAE